MESGAISSKQITASSEWDVYHAGFLGRLHFKNAQGISGGWTSLTNSAEEWLQVDLRERTYVTRVATQGRTGPYCCQWVSKYKLQYSDDGVTFQYYKEQGQITDKVTSYRQLNFGIRYPISVYGY